MKEMKKDIILLLVGALIASLGWFAKEFYFTPKKELIAYKLKTDRELFDEGSKILKQSIKAYQTILEVYGESQGLSLGDVNPSFKEFYDSYDKLNDYLEEVRRLGTEDQYRVVESLQSVMLDQFRYIWMHEKTLEGLQSSFGFVAPTGKIEDKALFDLWLDKTDDVIEGESYLYFRARDISLPILDNFRSSFEAVFRRDLGLGRPPNFENRQTRLKELISEAENFEAPSPTHPYTQGKARAMMGRDLKIESDNIDELEKLRRIDIGVMLLEKVKNESSNKASERNAEIAPLTQHPSS